MSAPREPTTVFEAQLMCALEESRNAREAAKVEVSELRELVRAAQHHIPRAWPQWTVWAADAWRILGEDIAVSGSADYCPPRSEGAG